MRLRTSQSRRAASIAPTSSLVALCLFLTLATPALSTASPDSAAAPLGGGSHEYEPDFGLFDRGIVGRAQSVLTDLKNNKVEKLNLSPGQTACYVIKKDIISRGKEADPQETDVSEDDDQDSKQSNTRHKIYLSANTCLQPRSTQKDKLTAQPGQLTIAISDSQDGGCGRELADVPENEKKKFQEGAVMLQANATSDKDLYVSIVAPDVDKSDFKDVYAFELVASTDMYWHTYSQGDSSELLWMDSDSSAALLVTRDLTTDKNQFQKVMSSEPPYELYAEDEARNYTGGLRASVCGLQNNAQILANAKGDGMQNQLCRTGMTTRGPGGYPKQQFYFEGLTASSSYTGILIQPPRVTEKRQDDATGGGGGTVFPSVSFRTVQGRNCKVLDGVEFEFCDEVNWAMPGNDDLNGTQLARVYDDYARDMYENFRKVLMQIPCEAPADQRYSLVRNCSDCDRAYKRWLCTVTIPRCEDVSSPNRHAVMRNIGKEFPNGTRLPEELRAPYENNIYFNGSRNKDLDDKIKPGPYKEILPCDDICYDVVQSCPAAMQFACPRPGWTGFNISYAERGLPGDNDVRCSFPGQSRTRQGMAAGVVSPAPFLLSVLPLAALLAVLV